MLKRILLSLALLASSIQAADFSNWVTRVSSIRKDSNGHFVITMDREVDGKHQNIALTDNDGVATLAMTQLMLVDAFQKTKASNITVNSGLDEAFLKGERRILSIQRDAWDKLIALLEGEVQAGKNGYDEALRLAREARGRFGIKLPWTMADIEKMGKTIQILTSAGGPYSADYTMGQAKSHFDDIMLDNKAKPGESFLSGAVRKGQFLPFIKVVSKSHVWIVGDLPEIERKYSAGGVEKTSFPKSH